LRGAPRGAEASPAIRFIGFLCGTYENDWPSALNSYARRPKWASQTKEARVTAKYGHSLLALGNSLELNNVDHNL
jgi:hypothetical protein